MIRNTLLRAGLSISAMGSAVSPMTALPVPLSTDSAASVFRQAREICTSDQARLWGRTLCGPIMLVDPETRQIVANKRDAGGVLKAEGDLFTGVLPASQNIANTATSWSGTLWTQIAWPLPADRAARGRLIAHEMFHRIQADLGFGAVRGGDNRHLDTLDGRYLIQLEWRALAAALQAKDEERRKCAISDALLFRSERYRIFPNAASDEAALELNEGLAEYTGIRAGVPAALRIRATLNDLQTHSHDASFVRSFAYATGPAYGLLLDIYMPDWRTRLPKQPRLDRLLASAAGISARRFAAHDVTDRAAAYDGVALRNEEMAREGQRQLTLANYRKKFVDGPVVSLPLRHMNIGFDPRNVQPLDDRGSIYPTARISDDWGTLESHSGILLSPKWDGVTLPGPATIAGRVLKGNGWMIDLMPGWKVMPGLRPGDLVLEPQTPANQ